VEEKKGCAVKARGVKRKNVRRGTKIGEEQGKRKERLKKGKGRISDGIEGKDRVYRNNERHRSWEQRTKREKQRRLKEMRCVINKRRKKIHLRQQGGQS